MIKVVAVIIKDVRSVLEELSLTPKYKKIFAEQEIDIQVFQSLSTCDLKGKLIK